MVKIIKNYTNITTFGNFVLTEGSIITEYDFYPHGGGFYFFMPQNYVGNNNIKFIQYHQFYVPKDNVLALNEQELIFFNILYN